MPQILFTKTRLDSLTAEEKRTYYSDEKQKGLRLTITPTGAKSYQFHARSSALSKIITVTLGKYGDLNIREARELAAELLIKVRAGQDPQKEKVEKRKESTLNEVFQDYLKNYAKLHKRSWEDDLAQYTNHFKASIGKKKLGEITQTVVSRWMAKIAHYSGKVSANRCHTLLSSIFTNTICVASPEYINPCRGLKKFPEESRERFLYQEELVVFFEALQQEEELYRDFFSMCLLTGQRKSNVLAMRWDDIKNGVWVIPSQSSKNKKPMYIPLVSGALNILERRMTVSTSEYVFPSPVKNKEHLADPKRAWRRVLSRSGLKDLRIHDLRRTMGSYQAMQGANMAIIGASLGHRDLKSTQIYARLQQDPVRQSMESASKEIFMIEEVDND